MKTRVVCTPREWLMATRFLISAKRRPRRPFHRATIFYRRLPHPPVCPPLRLIRRTVRKRTIARREKYRCSQGKEKKTEEIAWLRKQEESRCAARKRRKRTGLGGGEQSNFFQASARFRSPSSSFSFSHISRASLVEWRKIGLSRRARTPRVNKNLRLGRPLKTTKTWLAKRSKSELTWYEAASSKLLFSRLWERSGWNEGRESKPLYVVDIPSVTIVRRQYDIITYRRPLVCYWYRVLL